MPTPDWRIQQPAAADMSVPVQCTFCSALYDLCRVKTGARYSDCTCYTTPCCGRNVDDRPAGWVSRPAFDRLTREQAVAVESGYGQYVDTFGWAMRRRYR